MSVDLEYRILFQAYTPSRHAASWIEKNHMFSSGGRWEFGGWKMGWALDHLLPI